jgi:hypothetical protein
MDGEWFVQGDDKMIGPLQTAQLVELARSGRIKPDTLVRKSLNGKWVKASEVRGLFAVGRPRPPAPPPPPPTAPKAAAPPGFRASLVDAWRRGRGSWVWVIPLALVVLPALSYFKPELHASALWMVAGGLIGATILLRLLYFFWHSARFVARKERQSFGGPRLVARLGQLSLLLAPLVAGLAAAEHFGPERGFVGEFAERYAIAAPEVADATTHQAKDPKDPDPPQTVSGEPDPETEAEPSESAASETAEPAGLPAESEPEATEPTEASPPDDEPGGSERARTAGGDVETEVESEPAEPPAPGASASERTWFLGIGVRDYQNIRKLEFTVNDVEGLVGALKAANVPRGQILQIVDGGALTPDHAVLVAQIQEFLANPEIGADSQVIVYFSGHGLLEPVEQAMYLAPRDIDLEHIEQTGISAAWLREQIRLCQAGVKFLWIDACHSGGSRSALLIGSQLPQQLSYAPGVITISACTEKQYSWESPRLRHGLFTHSLIKALTGEADGNGNGLVTIDEVYAHVSEEVPIAAREFSNPQNPVRWIGPDIIGVPVVVQLDAEAAPVDVDEPETDDLPEAREVELGGTIEESLDEDFYGANPGQVPPGWIGDAVTGAMQEGELSWLEATESGWHYVRSSPFEVSGDFQLEIQFFLAPGSPLSVSLEGPGATDMKARLARNWGNGGEASLSGTDAFDVGGLDAKVNRLTIQRQGNVYLLFLNDNLVTKRSIDNSDRLQRLWLEFNDPKTRVYKVTLYTAVNNQGAELAAPKQLFGEDFSAVLDAQLPEGWEGPGHLGVLHSGSLRWLGTTNDVESSGIFSILPIDGDFELASCFVLDGGSNFRISLIGDQGLLITASVYRNYGSGGVGQLTGADPIEFDGLGIHVSRLALRRRGNAYTLLVDGKVLRALRIDDSSPPLQLEITLDNSESRVFDIGIWELPEVADATAGDVQ